MLVPAASILVIGNGAAALTVAQLLAHHQFKVELCRTGRTFPAPIVLADGTALLLKDLWPEAGPLLNSSHRVEQHHIRWGTDAAVRSLKGAFVLSQARLIETLVMALNPSITVNRANSEIQRLISARRADNFDWIIDASGRQAAWYSSSVDHRHRFGSRIAVASLYTTSSDAPDADTWMESTARGWTFYAPYGSTQAVVFSVIPKADNYQARALTLLKETRSIRDFITGDPVPLGYFTSACEISRELCGVGWLAVGDRAFAPDPICGDGVGYALRGAVLAAAAIRAITSGAPPCQILSHYERRIQRASSSHLRYLRELYGMVSWDDTWIEELKCLASPVVGHPNTAQDGPLEYKIIDGQLVATQGH